LHKSGACAKPQSIRPFEDGNGRIGRTISERALLRMLREGPEGFQGGLSAGNYATLTGATASTATRDLSDMVAKGALTRTGEHKHARCFVPIP
jgi:Fic family protein